eukprot:3684402-Pleurochrysis_carterae.AAC.1
MPPPAGGPTFSYVLIPWDDSEPLQQLSLRNPTDLQESLGCLTTELQGHFRKYGGSVGDEGKEALKKSLQVCCLVSPSGRITPLAMVRAARVLVPGRHIPHLFKLPVLFDFTGADGEAGQQQGHRGGPEDARTDGVQPDGRHRAAASRDRGFEVVRRHHVRGRQRRGQGRAGQPPRERHLRAVRHADRGARRRVRRARVG